MSLSHICMSVNKLFSIDSSSRQREIMGRNLELICCLSLLVNLAPAAIDVLQTYSLFLTIGLLTLTPALRSCATLLTETEWLLNTRNL